MSFVAAQVSTAALFGARAEMRRVVGAAAVGVREFVVVASAVTVPARRSS